MVQIRNMPEATHRKLKARAAEAGMSLSDYLLAECTRVAEIPTWAEMRSRLAKLTPVALPDGLDVVDIIREGREERETKLESRLL
jgi:hypothetical protein